MISLSKLQDAILKLADVYTEQEMFLTELDAAIGDADHGANMKRGFVAVADNLKSNVAPKTIGGLLKTVSMTLIRTVGGASGPLYGTWFLKASIAAQDKTELSPEEFCTVVEAGVQGIVALGKAEPGDKTMLDAWVPALAALKDNMDAGINVMINEAANAANSGMRATIPLLAKKGRASYLGDRSKEHQDPGATSTYFLLQTLAACITES